MALGKKTGGRKAGTPNKATADIKALAQKHSDQMFAELLRIATKSDRDETRVRAIELVLAYGHGRPSQSHELTGKDGKDLIPAPADREIARQVVYLLLKAEREPVE